MEFEAQPYQARPFSSFQAEQIGNREWQRLLIKSHPTSEWPSTECLVNEKGKAASLTRLSIQPFSPFAKCKGCTLWHHKMEWSSPLLQHLAELADEVLDWIKMETHSANFSHEGPSNAGQKATLQTSPHSHWKLVPMVHCSAWKKNGLQSPARPKAREAAGGTESTIQNQVFPNQADQRSLGPQRSRLDSRKGGRGSFLLCSKKEIHWFAVVNF